MVDCQHFYETYWNNREKKGLLHAHGIDWIPPRIFIASSMFMKEKRASAYVVDISCGEGMLGEVLKKEYKGKLYIIGMDISEKALSYAADNYDKLFALNIEKENNNSISFSIFSFLIKKFIVFFFFITQKNCQRICF